MFYYPDCHHLLDQLIWIHWKMSRLVVGSSMRKPLWMSVKREKILFENCWSNKKKKGWTHMNAFNMLGWLVIIGKKWVQFHEFFFLVYTTKENLKIYLLPFNFYNNFFLLFIVTRPWRLLAIDSLPSVRRSDKSMPIGMNLSCLLAGWVNFHPWENSKWRNTECKRSWLIANVLLQDLWLNLNQHLLWRDIVLDLLVELSGMYIFCLIHFLSVYILSLFTYIFYFQSDCLHCIMVS